LMAIHLVLCGNFFAFINRSVIGAVLELLPLDPSWVTVNRAQFGDAPTYRVQPENGAAFDVSAANIWHVRGPSWNGWMGLDGVKLAREAIGLSIALEDSHARMHRQAAQPSGVYSVDGPLTPEQHQQIGRASCRERVCQYV